jgi:hypothetical protein
LFPEDDLSDWDRVAGVWTLEGGLLTGRPARGGTFLCSRRQYGDFELKLQVRLAGANSGVQIRSVYANRGVLAMSGPQCDMGPQAWGGVWGEAMGTGWLLPASEQTVSRVVRANDFNDFYILCRGGRVTIKLNDEVTADGEIAQMPTAGLLAFQVHPKNKSPVYFRNIQIRELPASSQSD